MPLRPPIQHPTLSRRGVLAGMGAAGALAALPSAAMAADVGAALRALETRTGGRLGVVALDTLTNKRLALRAGERFAMCSTFKWALAAVTYADAAATGADLSAPVRLDATPLVVNSSVVEQNLSKETMSVAALCEAAMVHSDNTAANLLLARLGGPAGFTRRLRAAGDRTTRLDRTEPDLNENKRGDARDTTTPTSMVALMRRFLFGDLLSPADAATLRAHMIASPTGRQRLRAGLPLIWTVGDKTGTASTGAVNDVGFALPPGRPDNAPILIAAFIDAPGNTLGAAEFLSLAEGVHADLGRLVAEQFGT